MNIYLNRTSPTLQTLSFYCFTNVNKMVSTTFFEPRFSYNSIRNEIADMMDFKQVHGKGQEGQVQYEDPEG